MSFSLRGFDLAGIRVAYLNGVKQLGSYRLNIGVTFTAHGTKRPLPITVRDVRLTVDISRLGGGVETRRLGFAFSAPSWLFRIREYALEHTGEFNIELNDEQLAAVEDYRGQDGLRFYVTVSANAIDAEGPEPAYETCTYDANLSKWLEILNDLGCAEYLTISVAIAAKARPSELSASLEVVRRAHELLRRGEFEGVVATCRLALEGMKKIMPIMPKDSVRAYVEGRRAMTRLDREALIVDAVQQYSHLAHHVRIDGDHEIFSRSEATMILAATTSLLGMLASRGASIAE